MSLLTVALVAASLGQPPAPPPAPSQLRAFLELLQDQAALQASIPPHRGLVPISESNLRYTNTFINAVAAIAFTASGAPDRARDILDVLAAQTDVVPRNGCQGGLQKERLITGEPDPAAAHNDFFIGENAWLLASARYWQRQTGLLRYAAFIKRLEGWLACLDGRPPDPGMPAGYDKNGNLLPPHAEGSIDVVGSLNGSQLTDVQADVKRWLDQEVWLPGGRCGFRRGPDNAANLPLDHVAWGVLALPPEYVCLLRFGEALNARAADPHTIELFDHEPLLLWTAPPTGVDVVVSTREHGQGRDLVVTYNVTDPQHHNFLLLDRDRDVDIPAAPGFALAFALEGDGSGRAFDVKLRNRDTGEVWWHQFHLDFSGWRRIEVPYERFVPFVQDPPPITPLGRVDKIQFGLNTGDEAASGSYALGRIEYSNCRAPAAWPVAGFAAFQSERNWLFLEGTAAMAAAYCVSGEEAEWSRHVATLGELAVPAHADASARGLPSWFTGGMAHPEPNALGTAWLLIATLCVDPF